MRHKIFKKEDFFAIGNKKVEMDADVVELPETTPLVWNFDWTDSRGPYGHVTDIRVEDGDITGELHVFDPTFTDDTLEELGSRLGGFYNEVTYNEDRTRVLSCVLKGVSIVHNGAIGANPGARVQ